MECINVDNRWPCWHPTRNELSPWSYAPRSHKKVWWKTPKADDHPYDDHEWFQSIATRTDPRNTGFCPCCPAGKRKYIVYSNSLKGVAELGEFDEEAKEWKQLPFAKVALAEWDYEKNEKKPEEVAPHDNGLYWFICKKEGHSWSAILNNRTGKGHGCQPCSGKGSNQSNVPKEDSLASVDPEIAKLFIRLATSTEGKQLKGSGINSVRFPDQLPRFLPDATEGRTAEQIRPSSNEFAWWRCKDHLQEKSHIHPQRLNAKVGKNQGCSVCANTYVTAANSLRSRADQPEYAWLRDEFVCLLEKGAPIGDKGWGGDGPDNVVFTSHQKARWKCSQDHISETTVAKRAERNQRCGECQKWATSRAEIIIATDLKREFFPDLESGSRTGVVNGEPVKFGSPVDMYIPSHNIAIDFDPHRTHREEIHRGRDERKADRVNKTGIRLVRLRESPLTPITPKDDVVFPRYNGDLKKLKQAAIPDLLSKLHELIGVPSRDAIRSYVEEPNFLHPKEAEEAYQSAIANDPRNKKSQGDHHATS